MMTENGTILLIRNCWNKNIPRGINMREAENETLDTGKFGVRVKEVEIENENEDIVVAVHIHHIIVHPLRITLHILTAPSTKTMICTAMAIQTPQFHEQLGTHAITIVTHDRIQLHLVGALSPGKIRFVLYSVQTVRVKS